MTVENTITTVKGQQILQQEVSKQKVNIKLKENKNIILFISDFLVMIP